MTGYTANHMTRARSSFEIVPSHAALFDRLGLTLASIFTDPRIVVWRKLADRENAKLDYTSEDGSITRLHIKRYPPHASRTAREEINGFTLLKRAGIPTAAIVASGFHEDFGSFIILEDLAGYTPADKLLDQGFPFNRLLACTANLAAQLHDRRLHHRDLYLCHFMIKPTLATVQATLIDMARVARLNNPLTRQRWIVKDLAQFWFSTHNVRVTDVQREQWLLQYCQARKLFIDPLLGPVQRKSNAIARHDLQLRLRQPGRNVSIGDGDIEASK